MDTPKPHSKNYTEDRPWGSFTEFSLNEPTTVKIITVKAGEAFSLQTHAHRSESWHILSGDGIVVIGDAHQHIVAGEDYEIPIGTEHRIEAGLHPVVILEVARGIFDEKDITRLEDKYGRVAESGESTPTQSPHDTESAT